MTRAQIKGLFRFLLENRKLDPGIGQRILCRILRGIREPQEEKQSREKSQEMSKGEKKNEM